MTYGSRDPGKPCKSSGLSVSKYRKALGVRRSEKHILRKQTVYLRKRLRNRKVCIGYDK